MSVGVALSSLVYSTFVPWFASENFHPAEKQLNGQIVWGYFGPRAHWQHTWRLEIDLVLLLLRQQAAASVVAAMALIYSTL